MTVFGEIYVGNLGTDFRFLVQTTNATGTTNTTTDLTNSSDIKIIITDPDGTEVSYNASAANPPGTDGIAHFITSLVTSIWTQGGYWKARCKVTFNDGTVANTQDVGFEVLP